VTSRQSRLAPVDGTHVSRRDAHDHLYQLARCVPSELITFGVVLYELDRGPRADGWSYFLERAEKWADEYKLWVEYGRPGAIGVTDTDFAAALDRSENV
jgi:hypothetical protein